MRRFGWQIGGVTIAVVVVVALGVLAFGCGSGSRIGVTPTAHASPHASATPTADPRVADVEAAAKRYVTALANSMKTGSPVELDSLSVPGSQAEGNAGVAAHVLHDTGRAFVVTDLEVKSNSVTLVASSEATAVINYALTGYDADWPSLKQIASPRTVPAQKTLEFSLVDGRWLVDSER